MQKGNLKLPFFYVFLLLFLFYSKIIDSYISLFSTLVKYSEQRNTDNSYFADPFKIFRKIKGRKRMIYFKDTSTDCGVNF